MYGRELVSCDLLTTHVRQVALADGETFCSYESVSAIPIAIIDLSARKAVQFFICTNDEPLIFIAVRVHGEDRSPEGIHG